MRHITTMLSELQNEGHNVTLQVYRNSHKRWVARIVDPTDQFTPLFDREANRTLYCEAASPAYAVRALESVCAIGEGAQP